MRAALFLLYFLVRTQKLLLSKSQDNWKNKHKQKHCPTTESCIRQLQKNMRWYIAVISNKPKCGIFTAGNQPTMKSTDRNIHLALPFATVLHTFAFISKTHANRWEKKNAHSKQSNIVKGISADGKQMQNINLFRKFSTSFLHFIAVIGQKQCERNAAVFMTITTEMKPNKNVVNGTGIERCKNGCLCTDS